ncbi:MAG: hypothetical protein IJ449_03690, partial [Clostridia bacterium]|nr:hypothetical protein [Clostridia bacterium]
LWILTFCWWENKESAAAYCFLKEKAIKKNFALDSHFLLVGEQRKCSCLLFFERKSNQKELCFGFSLFIGGRTKKVYLPLEGA